MVRLGQPSKDAQSLPRTRRASVAIMAAVSMMTLVYAGAIALDLTNVYLIKSEDQRIADQSAIAGAFSYAQSSSNATTAAKAASSLALVNGAGASIVATSIVTSPSGDGENAVMVIVTSNVSLTGFGRATQAHQASAGGSGGSGATGNASGTIPVSATAYAEIHGGSAPPCIIALQTAGMTESGGVTTTATSCAIASNGPVSATSGAKITAQAIYAVTAIAATNGSTIATSPTAGQTFPSSSATPDPFANSSVFARLPTVAAMTAPMFPSVGSAPTAGTAIACSGNMSVGSGSHGTITATSYPTCGTLTFTGGAETDIGGSGLQVTGPSMTMNLAAGVYKFNGFTNSGYGTVTINMTGNVTLYIWGGLAQSGSANFVFNGTALYYIQGGITEGSSNPLTFTNTSATAPSTFYISGGIKVSNGSATFPNGTYVITSSDGTAGIDVAGGDSATFGNGSFNIAGGIATGGGSNLTIGSALLASSIFQIPTVGSSGNAMSTGGGNTLAIGAFTNVDLNGPVTIGGSTVTLGAGMYTVNGAVNISSSGGGSITGLGVQVVASGAISFGAGFNAVDFTAPAAITTATDGLLSTVSLATNSTQPFLVTAGASNTEVLGAVYAPNSALQLSGAGNLNGAGNCMQVVTASIALSGGSSLSTTCTSLGSSSSTGSVSLVQ